MRLLISLTLILSKRYHEKRGDRIKSLECLNTVIAVYGPSFFPAYIERSKHHLSYGNFILSEESALSALQIQKDHTEAVKLLILNQYLSTCNKTLCFTSLCKLVKMYRDQGISMSSKKWVGTAKLFSRICGRDMKTMNLVLNMLVESSQEANLSSIDNHVIFIEHARVLRCLGRYNDAILQYKRASNVGIGNTCALQGAVLCQMLTGNTEEAFDQIEFLSLLVQDVGERLSKFVSYS
jgi:tetratricopeptide repeat protein 21B